MGNVIVGKFAKQSVQPVLSREEIQDELFNLHMKLRVHNKANSLTREMLKSIDERLAFLLEQARLHDERLHN